MSCCVCHRKRSEAMKLQNCHIRYYSQACPCSHLYLKVTFSCPVIENFIWIEPLLRRRLYLDIEISSCFHRYWLYGCKSNDHKSNNHVMWWPLKGSKMVTWLKGVKGDKIIDCVWKDFHHINIIAGIHKCVW
jgi:hypothetical protein